ncbi:hypothetical protein WJX77_011956 [Trebouxia sp. C0004]
MQAWPRSTPACLTLYSPACFFLTSIAFTAGWTAISSLIGYYKALYGPHMLLHMNLAYFLPSLSTLMLQSVWDARVDGKYGIAKAATVRLCLGLGGSALVCAIYPFYETSRTVLLVLVSLLGLCNSVAFSTSYQIVTHFGTSNSVALTTGFVASGPIVVLAEAALRMGPRPSYTQQLLLFQLVAALTVTGWIAAMLLLFKWWTQLQSKASNSETVTLLEDTSDPLHSSQYSFVSATEHHSRHHSALSSYNGLDEEGLIEQRNSGLAGSETSPGSSSSRGVLPGLSKRRRLPTSAVTPLLDEMERGHQSSFSLESMGSRTPSAPSLMALRPSWPQALAHGIWPAALALFLSVSTSILIFPFFPYVPTSGYFGDALPQVLFGARVISDVTGRLLPRLPFFTTKSGLLSLALAKAIMTPIFFLYISSAMSTYNDWAAVLYITVFWLLSGYVNNCAYVMAPRWAPQTSAARAGGIMALIFQASSLLALLIAFWIEHSQFADV